MRIIVPTSITESMLVSSTVPEPSAGDGTLWNPTSSYPEGALVYLNHRRYQAPRAVEPGKNPATDSSSWLYLGPTNRWAPFDNELGTISTGTSPMTIVLRPGDISGVALFELSAAKAEITLRDAPGGVVVYDKEIDLDGSVIDDIYDWFFAEYEPLRDVVLTDLPASYTEGELTVELTGSTDVSIGALLVGKLVKIGETQTGASVGIIDYSRVTRDPNFGKVTIQRRAYSKRGNFSVMCDPADLNRNYRTLAGVRATPCVFIGTEQYGYEPLLIYGIFRSFAIEIEYVSKHQCVLEVEGMT